MVSPFIFLTLTHLFFLLPSIISQTTPTATPINITNILVDGHHFTGILRLLNQTQILDQLQIHLNNSNQGMTLFAPTDNAFMNLPAGTLNSLSEEKKMKLALYHILPKYYTMDDLVAVRNPVATQAGGEHGSLGLNFSVKANQVKVSTGVVETHIRNALSKDFPFALYVVDKVLFPSEFADVSSSPPEGQPAKAPSSPEGKPSKVLERTHAKAPSLLEGAPAKAPSSWEGAPAKAPSSWEGAPANAPSSWEGAPANAPSSWEGAPAKAPRSLEGAPTDAPRSPATNGGRRLDIGLGVAGGLVLFCIAFL